MFKVKQFVYGPNSKNKWIWFFVWSKGHWYLFCECSVNSSSKSDKKKGLNCCRCEWKASLQIINTDESVVFIIFTRIWNITAISDIRRDSGNEKLLNCAILSYMYVYLPQLWT